MARYLVSETTAPEQLESEFPKAMHIIRRLMKQDKNAKETKVRVGPAGRDLMQHSGIPARGRVEKLYVFSEGGDLVAFYPLIGVESVREIVSRHVSDGVGYLMLITLENRAISDILIAQKPQCGW